MSLFNCRTHSSDIFIRTWPGHLSNVENHAFCTIEVSIHTLEEMIQLPWCRFTSIILEEWALLVMPLFSDHLVDCWEAWTKALSDVVDICWIYSLKMLTQVKSPFNTYFPWRSMGFKCVPSLEFFRVHNLNLNIRNCILDEVSAHQYEETSDWRILSGIEIISWSNFKLARDCITFGSRHSPNGVSLRRHP